MAIYDCYFLNLDASFMALEKLDARTDAEAIVQAVMLAAAKPQCAGFELSRDGRHVHRHVGAAARRSSGLTATAEPLRCLDDPPRARRASSFGHSANGANMSVVPLTLLEARAAAAKARR